MTVHAEEVGATFVLTIDRPDRRNAVDHATLDALAAGVQRAVDAGSRAIVLTGAGGHFCAGADLTTLEDSGFATVLREVLDLFSTVPITTIAAIDGAALGGGTQLAISCDLRVATATARFGIPAAKLGLMVDAATVQRLAALAGASTARAMLLAAETIDGETAHRTGFVHRLGALDDALAWAGEIAALAPLTIAGHKLALERLAPPPEADALITEAFQRAWRSADVAEGRAAFHERRPPRFEGR
ncbi:MAG TPA: enoyl-CoA hydratase [Acidimicrobiales bacterium]|nr:enoyl-CoA hydratase [Acidimicrobiales bacterium]